MKILSVHNSYKTPGGEDQVFAQEAELLRSHGHQVLLYQTSNDQIDGVNPLVLLGKTIWNRQIHQELRALMQREKPDLVHVHNTFPLISPAAYYAANDAAIPVVQTLHNYRMLCPAGTLFRDGHVCEECVGRSIPWPSVAHACYRGSRAESAAGAAMLATHNYRQTWNNSIAAYIALTEFARNKFIEAGFPAAKIIVKPNYLQSDPGLGEGRGNFALFVGRIDPGEGNRHAARGLANHRHGSVFANRRRWSAGPGGRKGCQRVARCDLAQMVAAQRNPAANEGCVGAHPAVDLV